MQVEKGLYVANRRGDVVGHVATTAYGKYVSFDRESTPVGYFDTLNEAQKSVVNVAGGRPVREGWVVEVLAPLVAILGVMVYAGGMLASTV